MMTYHEALAYLETFANYERAFEPDAMRALKLTRMRRLCRQLGEPQRQFRSMLVAGTNGKGSVCAMLYAMLQMASMRIGFYCSPHLEDLRERIRVSDGAAPAQSGQNPQHDTDWISPSALASLVEELRPIFDACSRSAPEGPLTYFEVLTGLAFVQFARCGVQLAIVEVGLGGRLDATNVLEPAVSIITPIDIDHADILGYDPLQIAREKSGIIKPRQTVITSPQSPGVLDIIRATCDAQGVPLLVCGQDLTVRIHGHSTDGLRLSIGSLRGIYEDLEVPLLGRHQAENAAVAIAALETLSETGIPHGLVEQGIAKVEWPGRLEVVHEDPVVVVDGAHNPQSAQALRATVEELWPQRPIRLLIGVSSDKAVETLGGVLGPISHSVTCSQSDHPRALDPAVLAARLKAFCGAIHVVGDPLDAYTYVLNTAQPTDVIVVTGSLFFVGQIRAALRQAHVKPKRDIAQV